MTDLQTRLKAAREAEAEAERAYREAQRATAAVEREAAESLATFKVGDIVDIPGNYHTGRWRITGIRPYRWNADTPEYVLLKIKADGTDGLMTTEVQEGETGWGGKPKMVLADPSTPQPKREKRSTRRLGW